MHLNVLRTLPVPALALALGLGGAAHSTALAQSTPEQGAASNRAGPSGAKRRGRHFRPAAKLARLTELLELTPDQVELVRKAMRGKRAGWGCDEGGEEARGFRHRRHSRALAKFRGELEDILTPEQLEKFDAHMRERRQQAHARKLEWMKRRLGLSDDQVERIRTLLGRNRPDPETIRNMTPEQRREWMRAHHEQVRTGIEAILTPEQLEQFRSRPHGGPAHRGHGPKRGPGAR